MAYNLVIGFDYINPMMRKYVRVFLFLSVIFWHAGSASPVQAQAACTSVLRPAFSMSGFPRTTYHNHAYASANPRDIVFSNLTAGVNHEIACVVNGSVKDSINITPEDSGGGLGSAVWRLSDDKCFHKTGDWNVFEATGVDAHFRVKVNGTECRAMDYRVENEAIGVQCSFSAIVENRTETSGCFQPNDVVSFQVRMTQAEGQPYQGQVMYMVSNIVGGQVGSNNVRTPDTDGYIFTNGQVAAVGRPIKITFWKQLSGFLGVTENWGLGPGSSASSSQCFYESPTPVQAVCTDDERERPPAPTPSSQPTFNLCKQIPIITDQQINAVVNEAEGFIDKIRLRQQMNQRRDRLIREKQQCCECSGGNFDTNANECNLPDGLSPIDPANQGIYTAVGCIPSNSQDIVAQLVKIGLGIAGAVALLMILAGSFMLSTSQGEPKRAGEAKELITSAVMGLLFVIFSVTILQFIGVTILRIPGFGSP